MKPGVLILLLLALIYFSACDLNRSKGSGTGVLKDWVVEAPDGKFMVEEDLQMIEIVNAEGFNMWYKKKLTGEYTISYRVYMVMEGNLYDHLANLGCYWAASDPMYPKKFFQRSQERKEAIQEYLPVNGFYVNYGANDNTHTSFYRYFGNTPKTEHLPLKSYTDNDHLLQPDKWYQIIIQTTREKTTYKVNGEVFFTSSLKPGEGDGYFGISLFSNHIQLMDFKVIQ